MPSTVCSMTFSKASINAGWFPGRAEESPPSSTLSIMTKNSWSQPSFPVSMRRVSLAGDLLTIKGEKKAETQDTDGEGARYIERRYGAFARSVRLPFVVD